MTETLLKLKADLQIVIDRLKRNISNCEVELILSKSKLEAAMDELKRIANEKT